MAEPLIGVDELHRLVTGEPGGLAVLDPRWNLGGPDGRDEFEQGHVPGARWVDLETELSGAPGAGGRHPLPPYQVFAHAMRRVGVTDSTPVVVCDGGSILPAARLWWMLTDAGHPHVRVLDGGFAAWLAAGLPVQVGPDERVAPGDFSGHPGRRRHLDAAQISRETQHGATLLDVRAAERFSGATEPVDIRGGHIPGAVNAPSTLNFDADGRFRTPAELRARFADLGADSAAIVYCGSGITACQTLLAMEVAGIDGGTLFPGSWSSWIADPDRPVATGTGVTSS